MFNFLKKKKTEPVILTYDNVRLGERMLSGCNPEQEIAALNFLKLAIERDVIPEGCEHEHKYEAQIKKNTLFDFFMSKRTCLNTNENTSVELV